MDPCFEQFIQERKYLRNVSPRTLEWYGEGLRWLVNPTPDEAGLKDLVTRMRTHGLRPVSCNTDINALNSYLHWASGVSNACCAACAHLKVQRLRLNRESSPRSRWKTFRKLRSIGRRGFCPTRLHLFILALVDTGCRSGEALGLCWSDVDMDNLLLKLHGKGGKDRLVPFSFELRRPSLPMEAAQRVGARFPITSGSDVGTPR